MGRKRCVNPRFFRWLNTNFTGASGSSSSAPSHESPAGNPPDVADPSTPPPPLTEAVDYGLSPPSPPPNSADTIDLEEDIDDEEYARRLHVALNKGSRDIPADADIVSIDDSSDDDSGGGDSMDMDAPAEFYRQLGMDNREFITIEDMQPAIFKALLHFIYTDSMPSMEDHDGDEKKEFVKHLLVAADRYAMDRLKLICEEVLCNHVDFDSVATMLVLADQLNCSNLKDACTKYIAQSKRAENSVARSNSLKPKRSFVALVLDKWKGASSSVLHLKYQAFRCIPCQISYENDGSIL
ncbi:hypothetical protein EJB05_08956, partial [Eragrostis curvula]